jgi:tRNA(Ile)-lysidine synthase
MQASQELRAVPVIERIWQTIEEQKLFAKGETIVVGVSGGADSLCLLHALCQLSRDYRWSLHVAHLNHGLRGSEADADANFVRSIASDWGLACTIEQADVPAWAQEQRLAFEEAARRIRYAFLARVAVNCGARSIAVGHNADDQTETVLMHWIRGSGLAGLRGMLPRTPLSDYRLLGLPQDFAADLSLVRPLLDVPRAEIEAYCQAHHLQPRFDHSNLDTTYFRNWLRHEVLPLLASHNPNISEVIRRSSRVVADDYALLHSLLDQAWTEIVVEESLPIRGEAGARIVFSLDAWRALPTSLQRSTLREAIHQMRRSLRNINFIHVEDALRIARDGETGDQATLPQWLMLTLGYDKLIIHNSEQGWDLAPDRPALEPGRAPLPIRLPGTTPLPNSDWQLVARVIDVTSLPNNWQDNPNPWRAFLDVDCIGENLWLRTRRPGDRFQPLGMAGRSAKLGDFLTNQRVPKAGRGSLPLLEGPSGIMWVCGLRIDERARIKADTERVADLEFARAPESA